MTSIEISLSPEAEEVYKYLVTESQNSKIEKSILNSFEKKKDLIKANIHYGEPIAKNKIPEEYKTKYSVTNLFWVELSNFWRMVSNIRLATTTGQ